MKPILCYGHERSITKIKYNLEGDLLFSCAKDATPNVWFSLNGERLGTYKGGHTGVVWCIDVKYDTSKFLSGSGDRCCILWDTETGKMLGKMEFNSSVRSVNFNMDGNQILLSTDAHSGHKCQMVLLDTREFGLNNENPVINSLDVENHKITSMIWGPLDEYVITGHEDGSISQWDIKNTQTCLTSVNDHTSVINDIQSSIDQTYFISASKDHTAKLFDMDTLKCLKTYLADRPVNSASISPKYEHVAIGGGEEARDVTMTAAKSGKFETRFYHLIYEEEFARLKGHFGPINSLAWHPDGKSYSSGGEDGYVRINYFDSTYAEFKMF